MWMCWCVCDVKHLAPTVALNQLCSGPIMMTVTQTAAVGGVCLLCELTGYCVQATQWRWSAGKLNICQSHPWHTKTHRDVRTSEERGELLAKTGDSWKKRKKKQRFVCSWIMRFFFFCCCSFPPRILHLYIPSPSLPACSAAPPGRILENIPSPSMPGWPAAALPIPPGLGAALEPGEEQKEEGQRTEEEWEEKKVHSLSS